MSSIIKVQASYSAGAPAADSVLRSPNNMTSNSAPSPFVASSSANFDGSSLPYKCFDGSTADYPTGVWNSTNPCDSGNPHWVKIDLSTSYWLASYKIMSRPNTTDAAPKTFKLQGSTNDSSWTDVDSQSALSWSLGEEKTFTIASGSRISARYWRVYVTEIFNPPGFVGIREIKLYT